ncbi:hypothetical protein EV175_002293 [Coemansia sp. RSA 1933]|nr:hypothetical protein EV175_002293 [Coemansia sp. RSA 1933]
MNTTVVSLQPNSPTPCHPDNISSADGSTPMPHHQLSLALTRNQYSLECGGVLLDPATNEVCLLFYPDTSEWRLPMGKPDAMERHHAGAPPPSGTDPSVAGCEPPAHAAQRQISLITGYRCTHLHPAVAAQTKDASASACAYIGPHMVEPLALQIEQRVVALSDTTSNSPSMDLGAAVANVAAAVSTSTAMAANAAAADDDYQLPRSSSSRLVMTYYYTAWLTQSRFEAKAATLPVGPAAHGSSSDGVLTLGSASTTAATSAGKEGLPLAEVTWFKMDTAAQVLTHESDKLALREAIHRLTRLPAPVAATQARYAATALAIQHQEHLLQQQPQPQQHQDLGGDLFGASDLQQVSSPSHMQTSVDVVVAAQTANESSTEASASSLSSSSSMSDGATKADESNATTKMTTGRPSNMDILRKTATSISKRGGSLFAKSKAAAVSPPPTSDSAANEKQQMAVVSIKESKSSKKQSPPPQKSKQQITTAAVTAATTGKQAIVPRVMSIFYKLVGPSSSSNNNNNAISS